MAACSGRRAGSIYTDEKRVTQGMGSPAAAS